MKFKYLQNTQNKILTLKNKNKNVNCPLCFEVQEFLSVVNVFLPKQTKKNSSFPVVSVRNVRGTVNKSTSQSQLL